MKTGLIVFMRIFLVVFGLIFIGGGGLVVQVASQGGFAYNLVYGVIVGLAVVGGFALVWTGIFASPRTIEAWMDTVTVHEASLIPVLLSLPIFLIWAFTPSRWPPRRKPDSGDIGSDGISRAQGKRARRRKGTVDGG